MFRSDMRRLGGMLALTMSLVLAGPAAAAGRQGAALGRGPSKSAVRSSGAVGNLVVMLRQVGIVFPVAGLVASWLDEGHLIDPNGATTAAHPNITPATHGSNATSTDEGHLIDPNG
jgi:hypothetical protein